MSNRAMLYARKGKKMTGISEYNYEIPLAYEILVSQKTRRVHSKVFLSPFYIAIRGDYDMGVEKLYAFLDELKKRSYFDGKKFDKITEETRSFLEKNRGHDYFYLESAEVYESPSFLETIKMKKRISNIDQEIEGFFWKMDKLKQKTAENEMDKMLCSIGIQEWADYLYYDTI